MRADLRVRWIFVGLGSLCLAQLAAGQGGSFGAEHPFSAPGAKLQFAPDRMYHLENLILDLNVDYPNRKLTATAINTIQAIRDGVRQLRFHAGADTKIESVSLNDRDAQYTRDAEGILVDCPPTKVGEKMVVVIHYHLRKSEIAHGGGGGWHWHEPVKNDPAKVGLWTNGETQDTRDWAVTWDYPNDFTTTETRTTVPKDWQVIGNGVMLADRENPDQKSHTVVWRMSQPHATYLTSIVAGPFDIKKDVWRGVPLYYVAPKGKGKFIDYTFAHTKDMLSFYSDSLGFKYPWPKYAQDCVYDFGGGQENVSATTLGEAFLTDPRDGYYTMDSLNSHEMGHQWFGDCVTCKDWGQIWLNESFATWMEMTYTLHSEGYNRSMREVDQYSKDYFEESKRYKRPVATNFYQSPDVVFDEHSYPKGGTLLFCLQKQLGVKAFDAGLKLYLERHQHSPVETNDLCEALTDSTGINLHPWFDQWILRPGHPVISYSWKWDDARKAAMVRVEQVQDTSQGTPIYDVQTLLGAISSDGKVTRWPIHLTAKQEEFTVPLGAKPAALLFDPDHQFLREMSGDGWTKEERLTVCLYAPDPVSRQAAMNSLLGDAPSDAAVQAIVAMLSKDAGPFPAIESTAALASLKRAGLRSFWESELRHANFNRRGEAVSALADLPSDGAENARLRSLINDKEPYLVVAQAIRASGKNDFEGAKSLITAQAKSSNNVQVLVAAYETLVSHDPKVGGDLVFASLAETESDARQGAALQGLRNVSADDPRLIPALRTLLGGPDFRVVSALNIIKAKKLKQLIPDLEALKKKNSGLAGVLDEAIKNLGKG